MGASIHAIVPPIHPDQHIFDKRRVRREEGLNGCSRFLRPASAVPLEARFDPEAKAPHGYLKPGPLCFNFLFDEASGLWQYLRLVDVLPLQRIRYRPVEFSEQAVFVTRIMWWSKGESLPVSKVSCMLPRQCPLDTSQHDLVIRVVACIPDRHVLVYTMVCTQ